MNKTLIIVITVFVLTGIILLVVLLTKSRPSEPTCSGNGAYDSIGKKCVCNANWSGTDCETKKILFATVSKKVCSSPDFGLTWENKYPTDLTINPVCLSKSPKTVVTVGSNIDTSDVNNNIYFLTDKSQWTLAKTVGIFSYGVGVTWSESLKLFVAVGFGNNFSKTNTIAYSTDGDSWNKGENCNEIFTVGYYVVFGNNKFVAVGGGTNSIAVSDNGILWKGVDKSNDIFSYGRGITWNGKIFVAVGIGSYSIAWSSDGVLWNKVDDIANLILIGVAWSDTLKIFVAVGAGVNTIVYSNDASATTWTAVPNSKTIIKEGYCVLWDTNSNKFLVGGLRVSDSTSAIVFSKYGIKDWTNSTTLINDIVYSIL